jgi:hypothetical protein
MEVRGLAPEGTKFTDIRVGVAFIHDNAVYIKVDMLSYMNAVNIATGHPASISPAEDVTPLPHAVMFVDGVKS